jgi:hypothetical protein
MVPTRTALVPLLSSVFGGDASAPSTMATSDRGPVLALFALRASAEAYETALVLKGSLEFKDGGEAASLVRSTMNARDDAERYAAQALRNAAMKQASVVKMIAACLNHRDLAAEALDEATRQGKPLTR